MTNRKTIFKATLFAMVLALTMPATAKDKTIASPNGQLVVTLSDTGGKPTYAITLNGKEVMQPSRLGFVADFGDLTHSMTLTDSRDYPMEKHYDMTRAKRTHVDFKANAIDVTFANAKGQHFVVTFVVDNNTPFPVRKTTTQSAPSSAARLRASDSPTARRHFSVLRSRP